MLFWLLAAALDPMEMTAASNGDVRLVVWVDDRAAGTTGLDVWAMRVRISDGELLDPHGIPVTIAIGDQRKPAVATDGDDFLVVWEDLGDPFFPDVYGARVRAGDGSVLDPDGVPLTAEWPAAIIGPTIQFADGAYLVFWGEHCRVDPLGAIVERSDVQEPAREPPPGDDLVATWEGPGLPPDADEDGVHDLRDNCPITMNAEQPDRDADGFGDACDPDLDVVAATAQAGWAERILGVATLMGAAMLVAATARAVRQIRIPRRA